MRNKLNCWIFTHILFFKFIGILSNFISADLKKTLIMTEIYQDMRSWFIRRYNNDNLGKMFISAHLFVQSSWNLLTLWFNYRKYMSNSI